MAEPAVRRMAVCFTVTAFVSSTLVFVVQPLAARLFLPVLGGSPAVWNTSMVFFQATLLLGYLVAHGARQLPARLRALPIIGLLLVGTVVLPVALPAGWVPPDEGQAWWLLGALLLVVGPAFLAITTLSPTLQAWFASTSHPRATEPYFLYAAGNVGSIAALLAYPVLLEPFLGLRLQGRVWAAAYCVLTVMVVLCLVLARRHAVESPTPQADAAADAPRPAWGDRGWWVLLSALPSALLLAVTQYLTTDLASAPLLWVVPLVAYLATFVVAFGRVTDTVPQWVLTWSIVGITVLGVIGLSRPRLVVVGVAATVGSFVGIALWFHLHLAARRPSAAHVTGYFAWVSLGGLVGGAGVALVAPLVFDRLAEFPLLLVAALAVVGCVERSGVRRSQVAPMFLLGVLAATVGIVTVGFAGGWGASFVVVAAGVLVVWWLGRRSVAVVAPLLLVVVAVPWVVDDEGVITRDRSFFGAFKVVAKDGEHRFSHGSTIHGAQQWEPVSLEPLTYYARDTGVGRLLTAATSTDAARSIGVVGLGVGTLVAYGRPQDRFHFFEIDPDVERIARDSSLFTFLAESAAPVEITIGDGRRQLDRSSDRFDVLVLDAFSSDAIPTHLLTREAFEMYVQRVLPGGVLAVHVSNRHLDLVPVVSSVATALGWDAHQLFVAGANWTALTDPSVPPDAAITSELRGWRALAPRTDRLWTDDRVDLVRSLKW